MRWVIGYAGALCVLVLIVSQSVIIPTFFMPFFKSQYKKNNTAEEIGIETENLTVVTSQLLDYMRGRRESLDGITAEVNGRGERAYGENYFSATEIRHMADVRALYDKLFIVRNVSFFLLIALVLGMILMKERPLFLLSRCSREVLAGFLMIASILAIVIAVDFGRAWDMFHHIFFRGDAADFWRFTPYADLMINMFPLSFFLNIAIFFACLIAAFSSAVIIGATVYLRQNRLPGFSKP